jgi:Aldo/keto reductase family
VPSGICFIALEVRVDHCCAIMPQSSNTIPIRKFGRSDAVVSALGLGGHHLGDAADLKTAKDIVAEAMDGGITFFDNCWEYHRGKCEDWMGQALRGKRNKAFLMTKVCTHGRAPVQSLGLQSFSSFGEWTYLPLITYWVRGNANPSFPE